MEQRDNWALFLRTGLPQAYTFLKAQERRRAKQDAPGGKGRRG